ncbi:ABC transporter permease [Dactylosporangium sucinum]|uniref:ABC transporter permease n=2 Tax=Dactylosporangium sucinum TaxID=1424081 RepID=A0A917UD27_9ACTN|nr:ABC transporter permease [Dactylosporangium sucinum]
MSAPLTPKRMPFGDVVRVGGSGLRTHPLRVLLSALGIAIGIAAMVSIVGITSSGKAGLNAILDKLGTNMLAVAPAKGALGSDVTLPAEAETMIGRIESVESVTAIGAVKGVNVYRNDRIPAAQSNGITVVASRLNLPDVVGARVASGSWLTEATAQYRTVVLGSTTARWLGLSATNIGGQIWLGGRWFTLVGILEPIALAEELDVVAFIGWEQAATEFAFDRLSSTIYVRAQEPAIGSVHALLDRTANPKSPQDVRVSRPSDALAAKAAADKALTGLLVGLGAVALLVGGVGVANTMVISVLERRPEIGLRRSLGATRSQIWLQFLTESLLLSLLGGGAGVLLGGLASAAYAVSQDWAIVMPGWAVLGGLGVTLLIGACAGMYPAVRAARLSPTEALTGA